MRRGFDICGLWLLGCVLALRAPLALAQASTDRILLQEVMPALAGTPLGAVDVAQAPLPGSSITIRRSDVQRALGQAGLRDQLKASEIPRSVKISREAISLKRETLSAEAREALREAAAPCELGDVRYPSEVRVQAGPRQFRAEFISLHSGSLSGAVYVQSGGRETRVPVIANLSCPPPEVSSGAQVLAVAQVGPVKATAPAEARQPGRVGEIIRVTNRATGANLRARVINAHTVEVVP